MNMKIRKFFAPGAEEATGGSDYGYHEDTVKQSPFNFGLNAAAAKLIKFEWIPNGGKDGAEQEALDIVFDINGTEKSYRKFPVVKAFKKDTNEEVTDRNAPEFKEALQDFNATITHILHAFISTEDIKAGFARRINSFKEFCQVAASLLPANFKEVTLDIFLQYQWKLDESAERTYLEIPKKMKYGPWLRAAIPGEWTEHKAENIQETTKKALWYTNANGEEHPFVKNGWFMLSNLANKQTKGGAAMTTSGAAGTPATTEAAKQMQAGSGQSSAW